MRFTRFTFFCTLGVLVLLVSLPAAAQGTGFSVICDNGSSFDNGVEIIVSQMREGFTYTATAIGIDDFDPVLAVLEDDGRGLCSDDELSSSDYDFSLPTTGNVTSSRTSAQLSFNQRSGRNMADVSLVVGSVGNTSGEFVLILEGMAATSADGAGDPFWVRLTPGMVASDVPLTIYMVAVDSSLDPLIAHVDEDLNYRRDSNDNIIYCDDAGNPDLCWGESSPLSSRTDAMLSIPLGNYVLDEDPNFNFLNFLMTSYQQSTFGEYILAFHMGTVGETNTSKSLGGKTQPDAQPTTPPIDNSANAGLPLGVSVICDNGSSFDNGVEVQVDLMRAGFTYTATAIGIGDFDPVLAVLNEEGRGVCSDDERAAQDMDLDLPTTGRVSSSSRSAQLDFSQTSGRNMADVSLVVGSVGNTSGEFVLVIEGMAATAADGPGDTFSVRLTPGMVNSGIPLNAYMISVTNALNPLMARVDENYEVLYDADDIPYICDDAGDFSACWGESYSLNNSFVTLENGQRLGGFERDAMLSLPLTGLVLNSDPNFNFYNLLMTSYRGESFGDYVLVLHIGMRHSSQADV